MTVKQKVIKVLQVGMTRNLGGIETYLIEQFRHLDTSRIMYDFVNITGEYNICFEEEIKAKGNRIFQLYRAIKILFSTIGNGIGFCAGIIKIMVSSY